MKTCKVLGYTNPISSNSAPLITIININNLIYAQFPDSTRNQLDIDVLEKLNNFIPEDRNVRINEDEYSYMSYDGDVFTGTPNNILNIMKDDLKRIDKKDIHRGMLEELIASETLNSQSDKYNILKLLNISNNLSTIRFFLTIRIKNNHEKAKRIIFQIKKKQDLKHHIRKI